MSLTGIFPEDNVICFESVKLLKRWGVSLETGQQLWESQPEEQNNYYTMIDNYYNGMLLTGGYGGVILAYDIKTGEDPLELHRHKHRQRISVWQLSNQHICDR